MRCIVRERPTTEMLRDSLIPGVGTHDSEQVAEWSNGTALVLGHTLHSVKSGPQVLVMG